VDFFLPTAPCVNNSKISRGKHLISPPTKIVIGSEEKMMFDLSEEGIKDLISRGEGSNVEFKRNLVPSKVLDAFVNAFLNSGGGIILLGIDDSGEITGLSEQETRQALTRFHRVARAMPRAMQDGVNFRYGSHVIDDKNVAFLEVERKPHRAVSHNRFTAFMVESTLLLLALFCLWYLAQLPSVYRSAFGAILRPLTALYPIMAFGLFCVALECFLGLVFYGTAYEVTPLKLLGLFFPLDKIIRRLRGSRRSDTYVSGSSSITDVSNETTTPSVETEVIYQKASPLPPPELEQIEDTVAEATAAEATADKTDALFREISERASFLADRMENRTNTYMILGVAMGFIGMGFWYWSFKTHSQNPWGSQSSLKLQFQGSRF